MSLLVPHESEDIKLPSGTKAIRDLHISPYNGSHALCAALGRKLFILRYFTEPISFSNRFLYYSYYFLMFNYQTVQKATLSHCHMICQ